MVTSSLDAALDVGIDEDSFWNMSIGEVVRRVDSYNRCHRRQLIEKANLDYTLGNLIGFSVGRILDSKVTYPSFIEAYGGLFEKEEVEAMEQEQRDKQSIANFMNFAIAHNLKRSKEV